MFVAEGDAQVFQSSLVQLKSFPEPSLRHPDMSHTPPRRPRPISQYEISENKHKIKRNLLGGRFIIFIKQFLARLQERFEEVLAIVWLVSL